MDIQKQEITLHTDLHVPLKLKRNQGEHTKKMIIKSQDCIVNIFFGLQMLVSDKKIRYIRNKDGHTGTPSGS